MNQTKESFFGFLKSISFEINLKTKCTIHAVQTVVQRSGDLPRLGVACPLPHTMIRRALIFCFWDFENYFFIKNLPTITNLICWFAVVGNSPFFNTKTNSVQLLRLATRGWAVVRGTIEAHPVTMAKRNQNHEEEDFRWETGTGPIWDHPMCGRNRGGETSAKNMILIINEQNFKQVFLSVQHDVIHYLIDQYLSN